MSDNTPKNVRIDLANNSVAWSPCTIGVNLTIGSNTSIGSLAHIGRNVVIGDECRIQGGAYIADGCILGNQVFVGPNATLLNDRYPPSGDKALWQPINVYDGAVIGGGATVVAGCNVGKNSVLAAGAVLTKHLPEEEVWAGNPAKFMIKRSQYESKR